VRQLREARDAGIPQLQRQAVERSVAAAAVDDLELGQWRVRLRVGDDQLAAQGLAQQAYRGAARHRRGVQGVDRLAVARVLLVPVPVAVLGQRVNLGGAAAQLRGRRRAEHRRRAGVARQRHGERGRRRGVEDHIGAVVPRGRHARDRHQRAGGVVVRGAGGEGGDRRRPAGGGDRLAVGRGGGGDGGCRAREVGVDAGGRVRDRLVGRQLDQPARLECGEQAAQPVHLLLVQHVAEDVRHASPGAGRMPR
jgi:hypothetical protein